MTLMESFLLVDLSYHNTKIILGTKDFIELE